MLALPLVIAAGLLSYATSQFGLGVSHDSVIYLDTAQTLRTHGALARPSPDGGLTPLTAYPPLHPSILAALGSSMREIHRNVRPLSIALFAGTTLLLGLLTYRCTKGSVAAALTSSGLAALSFDVLMVYSRVWSEGPFLFLTLGGLLLLSHYTKDPGWRRLCLAAIPFALAWLTRYIGVVFLPVGVLAIWLLVERDRRTRILHSALYCVVLSTPMTVALMQNWMRAGNTTNRTLSSPAIEADLWYEGFNTVSRWLVPASSAVPLKVAAAAVLAGVLGLTASSAWRCSRRGSLCSLDSSVAMVVWLFLASYVTFLLFATASVDAAIPWSSRILSPVLVALFVLVPSHLREAVHSTRARYAVALAAVALLGFYGVRGIRWAVTAQAAGLHYNSDAWHRTRAFSIVKEMPACVELYTNNPELLQWITGRRAWAVGTTVVESRLAGHLGQLGAGNEPVPPLMLVLIHDFEEDPFVERFPSVMSQLTAVWRDQTASAYTSRVATESNVCGLAGG